MKNLTPFTINFEPPTLTLRARNNWVALLQQRLSGMGYYIGTVNGSFGNETRDAVVKFQLDHGLNNSGEVDGATWAVILHGGAIVYDERKIPDMPAPALQGSQGQNSQSVALHGAGNSTGNGSGTIQDAETYLDKLEMEMNKSRDENKPRSPFSFGVDDLEKKSSMRMNNSAELGLTSRIVSEGKEKKTVVEEREVKVDIPEVNAQSTTVTQSMPNPVSCPTCNKTNLGQAATQDGQIDTKKLLILLAVLFMLMYMGGQGKKEEAKETKEVERGGNINGSHCKSSNR